MTPKEALSALVALWGTAAAVIAYPFAGVAGSGALLLATAGALWLIGRH